MVEENTITPAIDTIHNDDPHHVHVHSHTDTDTDTDHTYHRPPLPKWYPKNNHGEPFYHGNPEALAWALDSIGRAVQFVGAGAFFGTALLRIAKEAAGCVMEPDPITGMIPECNETIYGIKPSSLLTTYTMIVGVTSATMLPLMGAMIDYTPYRLQIGQVTSAIFTCLIIPQIFLNENNFFVMAIIQVIISFVGWTQTAITYAYLPELAPNNEIRLNDYTKSFTICSFLSMVIYLALVIGGVSIMTSNNNDNNNDDDDKNTDILTSQVGMAVAFGINCLLLVPAWGCLFGPREALHEELPPGRTVWTAGFIQLWETSKHIIQHYPSLKWFYMSISMSDAALQALATIAITFMTDQLQFTATENGIAIMIMLLGSVPGATLANYVTKTMNDPLFSSKVSLWILIVSTFLFAIFVKGPNQQLETYILAFVWGIGSGWKWTCDRFIASSIIPEGQQDAELMGVFLFSGQCLSWLPPLIFTAINESGSLSQNVGVASLNAFFILALICFWYMGSYQTARESVNRNTLFVIGGGTSTSSTTSTPKNNNANNNDNNNFNKDDKDEEQLAKNSAATATATATVAPRKNTKETEESVSSCTLNRGGGVEEDDDDIIMVDDALL